MKRRLLSLWMALVLCLGLLPATAWAADGADITDWSDPSQNEDEAQQVGWSARGNFDIDWYTEGPNNKDEYVLYDAADLAGLAVIVNGAYKVKGNEDWYNVSAEMDPLDDAPAPNGSAFKLGEDVQDDFAGKTIVLAENTTFDLSGKVWVPIGYGANFRGTFEGNSEKGTKITGMTIQSTAGSVGLFGQAQGATIQNVAVENAGIMANLQDLGSDDGQGAGGIVGYITQNSSAGDGLVTNCTFSGTIEVMESSGYTSVGGIVGHLEGSAEYGVTVANCVSAAAITGRGNYIGGVAGWNNGYASITGCRNEGEITPSGGAAVGGIIGYTRGDVTDCVNNGALTWNSTMGNGNRAFGGVAGMVRACKLEGCVNNAAINVTAEGIDAAGGSGQDTGDGSLGVDVGDGSGVDNPTHSIYVGGVAGLLVLYSETTDTREPSFADCHNRADVSGYATTNAGTVYLGGVLGGMLRWYSRNVVMERCSNTGDLTAGADRASIVGGLVGFQSVTGTYRMTVSQCYNAGTVTIDHTSDGNYNRAGGLMGSAGGTTVFTDCYNVGDVQYTDDEVRDTKYSFYLGGLAGKIDVAVDGSINTSGQNIGSATFTRCYNAGTVDANGQKGVGIGGITGGLGDGATISVANTSYLTGCVTNAGGTTENNSGASKSANDMTEDYTWATNAYLGLGTDKWEKQANDLTDETNLIGYLPVLKNNKQDPAPWLQRTVAKDVTVTITGAPENPVAMGSGPITLTAAVTGGTYQTLYWTTGSDAVATVSGSSTGTGCTFEITGPGTTVITAVAYDSSNEIVGSGYVTLEVHGSPVSAVTISGLTAPVQGTQPVASASVASTAYYTLDKVEWTGALDSSGLFELGKAYTAVFTLSPKAGCSFTENVTVTLENMLGDAGLTYTPSVTKTADGGLTVQVTFDSLPHTHKWASYWSHDASGHHWHDCLNDDCDITEYSKKDGYAAHSDETMLWRDDGDGNHYLKCYVCGATYGTEMHSSNEWRMDTQTDQHYQVCDTCGKIFNQGDHEAGDTWYEKDDAAWGCHTRYQKCKDCGAEMNEETHKLVDTGSLNDYRYWFKNDTEHWQECNEGCGELNREAHKNGYVPVNALTHRAGCPVCGYVTDSTLLPHVDTNGDRVCDQCGASIGYQITFYDSNGNLIPNASFYTDTYGKLAAENWPDPGDGPAGKVFIGWYTSKDTGGTRYTEDSKFTYSERLYPRWGDYHSVTVEETENGTVTADKTTELVMNETVTLTVSPAKGYRMMPDTLIVTNISTGDAVHCKEQTAGTYTFTMPDGDVTVSAQFEELPTLYFVDRPTSLPVGQPTVLTISYGGSGTLSWEKSGSEASVYWTSVGEKLYVYPTKSGQLTVTVTDGSVSDSLTITCYTAVSSAAITGLTAPAYGATPVTAEALAVSDSSYSVKTLVWQDESGEPMTGSFAENTAYTAVITLQAQEGYRFRDTALANVDGTRPGSYAVSEDGKTMTIRVTFSQTGHAHQWSDWINAGYQHYRQCTVSGCSEREFEAHTVSEPAVWSHDALHHYNLCDVCGGEVNTASHTGAGGEACTICGGIIGYEITLNPNGGTCAAAKVYTNTYGYLDGSDLPVPTNGSLPFQGWYTAETGGSLVTGQYRLQSDTILYARWGEAQQYSITVTTSPAEGGTVAASAEQAEANTTVSLTVTPADGYQLKAVTARDADGNSVAVTNYQFTMPASNVTVTVEFEPIDDTAFTILGLPQRTIYAGDTFRLTASGGSGSGTVTWTSSAESVATVDSGGNVKVVGTGTVTITAQRGGETAQVSFTVSGQAIDAVTILNLKAPVQGENPDQTILVPVDAHYGGLTQMGVGGGTLDVIWKDSTGATVANTVFTANQVYTAVITLQAKDGYTFADQVAVTLESLQESAYSSISAQRNAGGQLEVTITFNTTDHQHSWATEWSSDPLHHWYACLAEGCPALTSGMKDYGYHTDSDGDGLCDDCGAEIGYTVTFDAGGGKVEPADTRTDTYGQLTIPLPTPTGGSGTFTGWFLADGTQVTQSTVYAADTTIYARWYVPGGGGGGAATYPVTVEETEHGTVTVSPKSAAKGGTITVTTVPDEGYELVSLTVTDKSGGEVELTDQGDGVFTFRMPGSSATVEAVFGELPPEKPDYGTCDGGENCPLRAFADVDPEAWYHDGIHFCLDNGLMEGYGNGLFGPSDPLTRGMLAQILYNCEGRPAVSGERAFADVAHDAWYTDAVAWAAANGIVEGYGDGDYGPNDSITREQLAFMLWRYAGKPVLSAGLDRFPDGGDVSLWAADAMSWAVGEGILEGDDAGLLKPQGQASRAEACTMLMRFITSQS